MKKKFKEWFNRYKYPEIAASTAIVCLGLTANYLEVNKILESFLLTWTEFIAFYSVVLIIQIQKLKKENKAIAYNKKFFVKEIGILFLEFGPAAILDFMFIRPFFMYHLPIWTFDNIFGIILGKVASDIFFYTQTIINYEWINYRKKRINRK
jgi:hypothetical protein